MLISLYKLDLFVVRPIGTSLDAVADVLIDALDRDSTAVLRVASRRHLIIVPGRRHDDIGHLCRGSGTAIIAHYVFDDSSDLSQRLSFLVIAARGRGVRFRVVVALTRRQDHPSVAANRTSQGLVGCHSDIVGRHLLRLLLSKLLLIWIVVALTLRTVN